MTPVFPRKRARSCSTHETWCQRGEPSVDVENEVLTAMAPAADGELWIGPGGCLGERQIPHHNGLLGGKMTLATSRPVTRADATTAAVTAVSMPSRVSCSRRDIRDR